MFWKEVSSLEGGRGRGRGRGREGEGGGGKEREGREGGLA